MESLFEFDTHFSYLKARLENAQARGSKQRFSEHVRIQPAFLSQVLAQKYPLSLEQADLANSYWEHTLEESEFFLLLVSRDRAGSESLKHHFSRQIELIRLKRLEIIQRLGRQSRLSPTSEGIYYSSWLYSAIHVATTVPALRKLSAICDYFRIPIEKASEILTFLEVHNLVEKKDNEFHPTKNWVRLSRESPHIAKLHTNWRQRAIQNVDTQKLRDLHFTGVYSLDAKTAKSIREALMQTIDQELKKVASAPEKELYCFGLDFFDLKMD